MGMNFEQARHNMIAQQVRPWDVFNARVLAAMEQVRREDFVPHRYRRMAFSDIEIPLTDRASMMKPVVEGRMLQALAPESGEYALEIGTGSGFITACMAHMGAEVDSLEIDQSLHDRARQRLHGLAAKVRLTCADALNWQAQRRYHLVAVTGSLVERPERVLDWLLPNGRAFVVLGRSPVMEALLIRRGADDRANIESLFETDLAPLVGAEPIARFEI